MTTTNCPTSGLHYLASRLEQDIRQRGLWAGDRYLSATEAAEMLGVSTATAHRVMHVLAKQHKLVRHRSRGTFVGPHFEMKQSSLIRTVCVLMPSPGLERDTIPLEPFIYAIRSRISQANVPIHFLPESNVQTYVQDLLQSSFSAGNVAGFVPVSCPREVYRRLADSGIPTVVFGTPSIDQRDIPSLDVDNFAAGQILTEHLTKSGHRRMAAIMALEGQPGTNCFYDGVSEALTAAGLPHNALIQRIVAVDPTAVAAQLRELLGMSDGPTALIARTPAMAKAIAVAFDRMEIPAAKRCEVVYQNHPATDGGELPFSVCVRPQLSFTDMVARIGDMLEQLGRGEPLDETRVVIPVELCRS